MYFVRNRLFARHLSLLELHLMIDVFTFAQFMNYPVSLCHHILFPYYGDSLK